MNGLGHWDGIEFFRPTNTSDKWGNPHRIERQLLLELDALRRFLGLPIHVTSGFRLANNGNEGSSQHCYGKAVDIVVPTFKDSLLDLYFAAARFEFNGIGIYRDWTWHGKHVGGLHVDVRREPKRAQWFCYKDTAGVQQYITLNHHNLQRYGII